MTTWDESAVYFLNWQELITSNEFLEESWRPERKHPGGNWEKENRARLKLKV
jgi:hypothetical protein